jgi:catechol-2,3-dioxygenase
MLNISHVDHLNMNVSDLRRSIQFYAQVFGLKVFEEGKSSSGNPYKIIGLPGSLFLCLYENGEAVKSGPLNHVGIHVQEKIEVVEAKLNNEGIPLNYGGIVNYPHSRSVYISDPDGNEIELSEVFGGGLGIAN